MAAAGAAFSIREYAARARGHAEESGRGWPFGGDAGLLPPVEVRRFRWWEDEAAVAVAAAEDEEGEVERRMAAKRRKRSVAELFAAAPRVARGKGKAAKRRPDAKENGKGKVVLAVPVRVKANSGGNKKKKKKVVTTRIDAREKEKSSVEKATSVSISQLFQRSKRKKKPKDSLREKRGSQEVSVLLDRKGKKGNRKSVLERHKKAITKSAQAQSTCKKQSKAGFSTVLDNTGIRCKSSSSKSKLVTFSDGTDTFRWTAHLPEDNTEQPQSVQTSWRPTREGHDHRNTDKPQLVCQQADIISGAVENTSSLSENVVSTGVYRTVPLNRLKDTTILGSSMDLNHCIETSNSSNCLNSISLACLSRKVPGQNFNDVNSHLDSNDDLSPDVECLGEGNYILSQASHTPASLTAKAKSGDRGLLSQPSSSCLYDRSRSTLQERSVANYHLGKVHPEFLRSGKDVVRSINSSIGSHKPAGAQAAACVSAGKNMHLGDDYLGLPINSRGEFVKVHPGGTPNSADVFKRQCFGDNSSSPAIPTILTPSTHMDHVNLRPNHHARQIYTVDQSVFHADPRFTPTTPTAYGMDFRQLPTSERTNIHYYRIPSNKYPCTNQQDLSVECFCSGCMRHHNPEQRLLGMQSRCLRQNSGQNTQHNAETTMRLMGKTVTLGTNAIQCRGLDNETPCSSKQTGAQDQFFQGTRMNVFPQLFHGGLVDPPSACRISDGERQQSGNPSHFSFVPAATPSFVLDTSSFRTNNHVRQPELGTANNVYVHPAGEGEIGHKQPVTARQVQSNAEDMLPGSVHARHTVAPGSSLNRRNSIRNFMEERPTLYQSSYLTQQFSRTTQRPPISPFPSGYPVQNAPGMTNQTKFTSLRPLPPSVIPSQVNIADYAPTRGSVTAFHPPPYPVSNHSAPGSALFEKERMRWSMMGSNPEGSEHTRRNCKRPAEKDDAFLVLPKKPTPAARKELNMLSFPENGLEFRGSRPDPQGRDVPVRLDKEPEADLRLGNGESHGTWSAPANVHKPLKLKPGAKHVLQPSTTSGAYQGNPWPVHSVTPLLAPENDSCALSTSKTRDAETYKF
ncbi:unnamed protein product [Urochloa decumbens]|uniref:Uncharacterized protein n=1 Tax=Urochloa decumbens TaxID=240449 RepID=A0ABC8W453_9POAL